MKAIEQAVPQYGYELLAGLVAAGGFEDCVVLCAPEAWALVERDFPVKPRAVAVPESMEQRAIERQLDGLPRATAVFGVGGGSACDAAKLYAIRRGARLVLMPSILSVDAAFTKAVGLREDGRVRYFGAVIPEHLLIDFGLISRAPLRLNRSGVGDILSIHTALWDWQLAARHVNEPFDGAIATRSRDLLSRLLSDRDALSRCDERGLRLISELYAAEVELCERWGNSRPEEGSEHYLAYCLESLTRAHYLHGELIALCVLLTALYQGRPVNALIDWLERVGVAFRPEEINVDRRDLRAALLHLPAYLRQETQLLYGVFHHRGMTEQGADELLRALDAALDA